MSWEKTIARGLIDATVFAGTLLVTENPKIAFEAAKGADGLVDSAPDSWFNDNANAKAIGYTVKPGMEPNRPNIINYVHNPTAGVTEQDKMNYAMASLSPNINNWGYAPLAPVLGSTVNVERFNVQSGPRGGRKITSDIIRSSA